MDDIRKCSICVDNFRTPKIIPCFHTFCRDCLLTYVERVLKNGKFNCPICRTVIENPKKGVDGFQTNFYIEEITKDVETPPKPKHEAYHPLVEIKEGRCGRHEGEKLSIYCEDCNVPCCRDCKIEAHDGHRSVKLEEKVVQLYQTAEELILTIKIKLESSQKRERKLNEELKVVKEENNMINGEIMKRKAMVEEQVAKYVDATVAELQHLTKTASNNVAEKLKKVTSASDELQKTIAMLEQTIESQDPLQILQVISNIRETLNVVEMNTTATQENTEKLFPGLIFQASDVGVETTVASAMGKVFFKKHPRDIQNHLKNISKFHVDLKNCMKYHVKAILPVSQNFVWLAVRRKKESDDITLMKKFSSSGNEIMSFLMKGLVNSMTNFEDGTLVVTMPFENKICTVEGEDNVSEFAYVKLPLGIACIKDELFVCSVASSDIKDRKPYNVNRVLILSKEGAVKRTVEFLDGRCLFTYPGKISVNYRGDIIVLDFGENKIICIDSDGRPKHTYQGENDVFLGSVFCDDAGYVLVDTSKGIHVLDDELNLVQTYDVTFDTNPMVSMAVGQNGHLYTVDALFTVSVWKYA